jgi:PA14 domain
MKRPSFVRAGSALLLLAVLASATSGCVDAENEVVFPAAAPSPAVSSGNAGLASGCEGAEAPVGRLRGRVYALPLETRTLPDFETLDAVGTLCLDRLAVTERRSFPGIANRAEWFGVSFDGVINVTEAGPFYFRLTSDDGSQLYIDGALVIDNDGYHQTRARDGAVSLAAGPHPIAVPYWQGPGPLTLTLEVARPGESYEVFQLDRPLEGAQTPARPTP